MSASGVSVDPEKVEAVMSWERPKPVFKICSFLGLAGYYRIYIQVYNTITKGLLSNPRQWRHKTCSLNQDDM